LTQENKFRSSTNARYLKGLFFETTLSDKSTVLYTLKDQEHEGYPSLYQFYMDLDDLTEYEFANKYLDGWEHWTMLTNCNWFRPYVERWRKELELRTKAKALRALQKEAKGLGKNAYSANKILLEGGWKPKETTNPRGRPTKAEVERLAKVEVEQKHKVNKDFERVLRQQQET
jgi:hypothetical protein